MYNVTMVYPSFYNETRDHGSIMHLYYHVLDNQEKKKVRHEENYIWIVADFKVVKER